MTSYSRIILAAALLLSGCRTGRDVATAGADNKKNAPLQHAKNATESNREGFKQKNSAVAKPSMLPANPPYAVTPPAPDAPGRQHRQYRRNLRAQPRTVPLIQGRAAVNAPLATAVVAAYKPEAPIVQADSGASVQVATAAKGAQAAAGEGITQPRTETAAVPWWKRVLSYWPWLVAGVAVWLLWPAIMVLLRRLV